MADREKAAVLLKLGLLCRRRRRLRLSINVIASRAHFPNGEIGLKLGKKKRKEEAEIRFYLSLLITDKISGALFKTIANT